jgi:membrane protease YdiL (CAAX protease family)
MELSNGSENTGMPQSAVSPGPVSAPAGQSYDDLYSVPPGTPAPQKKKFSERIRAWIKDAPVPAGFWFILLFLVLGGIFTLPAFILPEGTPRDLASEIIKLVWPFLLLYMSGYLHSLQLDPRRFGKTFLIALPMLLAAGAGILYEVLVLPTDSEIRLHSGSVMLVGLIKFIRIAVTEVMIFIGVTARSIGEEHGKDQEGVWYSALISGLIFGLYTFVATFLDSSMTQASELGLCTAVLGTVYAAIYYRGGSLYPVMLLHFLYAAAQEFTNSFVVGSSAASFLSNYSSANYCAAIGGIILIGFLLRRKKIREAVEFLRGKDEADLLPGEMTRAQRRQAKRERLERRRDQLREQYADAPLWFRLFRIYMLKPIGTIFGIFCCAALVFLGLYDLYTSPDFSDTFFEMYNASGRTEVDRSVIEELSPIDTEGADAINALPRGKETDTWTICLYIVGSNLEDMGENDLSVLVRTQIYEQRKKIAEEKEQAELKRLADFADELDQNGVEIPAYLFDPVHPVAYTDYVKDEVVVATSRGAASMDIDEILAETWNDQISVVIQTGGATRWSNQLINPNRTQRFLYKNGSFEELENLPLQDSCSADTLADFLSFCDDNYRSDHNILVLWDHGGGVFGYGSDSIFGTGMSLGDVRSALAKVYKADRRKPAFDVIGYDACLMSSLDVIHYMDGYASYLAVSEESEPGFGWEYTSWLQSLSDDPAMSPAQAAMSIADTYTDYYMRQSSSQNLISMLVGGSDVTFSVIDVNKGCELYDAYCALTKKQLTDAAKDITVLSEIGRCGRRSTQFAGSLSFVYNTIDLGNYVDYMIDTYPAESSKIKNLLEETVLYHRENGSLSDAQGLSIYLPCSIDSYYGMSWLLDYIYNICEDDSTRALYYYKMAGCLNDEMLQYVKTLSKDVPQVIDTSVFTHFAKAEPVIGDDGFSVGIDAKMQSMTVGYYTEATVYDPENYLLIELGYDENAVMDGEGSLVCEFDGSWICLDSVPLATDVISATASSVEYRSKVKYNGSPAYLLFNYDRDTDSFSISGITEIPSDEEDVNFLTNTKSLEEVEAGSTIIPLYQTNDLYLEKVEEKEGKSVTFGAGSSIDCKPLVDGYYLTTAVITDQRGDRYYSKVIGNTVSHGTVSERKVDPTFFGTD